MKPSNDREAITLIIKGITDKGVVLDNVHDGEEFVPVSTIADAVDVICSVDEATLNVYLPTGKGSFVWFVQGNDPEEVAADYGVSLEEYLDPIVSPWWE